MADSGMTNIEVKRKNRNRIYRYIHGKGTVSNPVIAYELKLSLPTVTQNTKELLEMGLLQENGVFESTGGRKAKALSAAAGARLAVGLDITKEHTGFLLTDLSGEIRDYKRIRNPFSRSREYFSGLSEKLEEFLEHNHADKARVLGAGISIPGIVNLNSREITDSHALNIRKLSFREIEEFFHYPCFFLNDANAGAYAEGIRAGEKDRFFYLSLSDTVGGAVFSGGRLVYGQGFRCGEAGHMTIVPEGRTCYCGKRGCLDAYCSAKRLSGLPGGKVEDFFAMLDEKNEKSKELWREYVGYLSIAVNNIHMILDCDIILGGEVGSCLSDHIREIKESVSKRDTFPEEETFIRGCSYKTGAAALGCALYVVELFIEQI